MLLESIRYVFCKDCVCLFVCLFLLFFSHLSQIKLGYTQSKWYKFYNPSWKTSGVQGFTDVFFLCYRGFSPQYGEFLFYYLWLNALHSVLLTRKKTNYNWLHSRKDTEYCRDPQDCKLICLQEGHMYTIDTNMEQKITGHEITLIFTQLIFFFYAFDNVSQSCCYYCYCCCYYLPFCITTTNLVFKIRDVKNVLLSFVSLYCLFFFNLTTLTITAQP